MAFDENEIHGVNLDKMSQDIGPDLGRFSTVDTTVNLKNQFGAAHGPGYASVAQMGPSMQAELAPVMNDPTPIEVGLAEKNNSQDLWANSGPERNPILDKVDNASFGMGASSEGAMKIGQELGNQLGELTTGIFDLINPAKNDVQPELPAQRLAMNAPAPSPFA